MTTQPDSNDPVEADARAVGQAVGRRIKAIRVAHGHSQEALGRLLGLTFQQVQKYEQGANRISAEKLWRVARHYGVQLEYFYEDLDAAGAAGRGRAPHERLRLEIGREARRLEAPVLRAVLNLMRSATGSAE